jgi:PAS domain S-box-containing protein
MLGVGNRSDVLDNVGCGIWVYDGDDTVYVNHALEEITGYTRDELLSPRFFQGLVHADDVEMIVARGKARLRGEDVPDRYEISVIAKDGARKFLSLHARRIELDGHPVSVVSAVDITALREAERTIREGTSQLIALLNSVPAHIITTNAAGRPTFVNRHWLEFTGQSQAEAMEAGTAPLIHPDDLANATRRWSAALRSHKEYEIEYRIRDRNGDYRWQLFRIRPVQDAVGRSLGWTSVSVDIQETRELQAELELAVTQLAAAVAAKDEVLGLISHELRTPLTTLLGNASYLQRHADSIDPQALQSISRDLEADASRLSSVIENMLVLSRTDAGQGIETEPSRLNRLAEATITEFLERNPGREVVLIAPESLPIAEVHAGYYRQILANLLSNAHKYSPPDCPIVLEMVGSEAAVETRVRDCGKGIPPEELDRVFSAFYRSKQHPQVSGIGLGLTVCQRLVQLLGGVISVQNLGPGCQFSFTVPLSAVCIED